MAFTDHCDLFASVSESFINSLIANIARQRPSLFNYGTQTFVSAPQLMCQEIEVANGLPANQPLVTLEQPLPVPGTNNSRAFEWCAQLTELEVDFHPGNRFTLPPELPPLADQGLALHAVFCAAIGCPSEKTRQRLEGSEGDKYVVLDPALAFTKDNTHQQVPSGSGQLIPVNPDCLPCFCVEVFATAQLVTIQNVMGPVLRFQMTGFEIVDIKPDGLEQSLECLLAATISLGILPRLRVAVRDILLDFDEYCQLSIGLTPTSASLPFNPSIDDDRLSVFVDVDLN